MNKQRSIRTDQYKLIVYPNAEVLRLYDIANDPLEMKDLAGDDSMAPTVAKLFGELQTLQSSMNDSLDLSALAPKALQTTP